MNTNDAALTKPRSNDIGEHATKLGLAVVRQAPAVCITTEETTEVIAVRIHVDIRRSNTHHLQNAQTDSENVSYSILCYLRQICHPHVWIIYQLQTIEVATENIAQSIVIVYLHIRNTLYLLTYLLISSSLFPWSINS